MNSRLRWFRYYRSQQYPFRLAWRVARRKCLLLDPDKIKRDSR